MPALRAGSPQRVRVSRQNVELQQVHAARLDPLRDLAGHQHLCHLFQGFRGGEWNSVIPGDNPAIWFDAKQETVDAYEVGFKTAGSRLRFELAGFYYDYKNLQVSYTSSSSTAVAAASSCRMRPRRKIYGVEANFDYEVTDNFKSGRRHLAACPLWRRVRLHRRSASIRRSAGVQHQQRSAQDLPERVTAGQDLSGLQMARAPDFSGFLGFEYNIPKGDGGLRFAANVKYTSSYVVTNPSIWGGERRDLQCQTGCSPRATPAGQQSLRSSARNALCSRSQASSARAREPMPWSMLRSPGPIRPITITSASGATI